MRKTAIIMVSLFLCSSCTQKTKFYDDLLPLKEGEVVILQQNVEKKVNDDRMIVSKIDNSFESLKTQVNNTYGGASIFEESLIFYSKDDLKYEDNGKKINTKLIDSNYPEGGYVSNVIQNKDFKIGIEILNTKNSTLKGAAMTRFVDLSDTSRKTEIPGLLWNECRLLEEALYCGNFSMMPESEFIVKINLRTFDWVQIPIPNSNVSSILFEDNNSNILLFDPLMKNIYRIENEELVLQDSSKLEHIKFDELGQTSPINLSVDESKSQFIFSGEDESKNNLIELFLVDVENTVTEVSPFVIEGNPTIFRVTTIQKYSPTSDKLLIGLVEKNKDGSTTETLQVVDRDGVIIKKLEIDIKFGVTRKVIIGN